MIDAHTYEQKFNLLEHKLIVTCVILSKNGDKLFSSSGDK